MLTPQEFRPGTIRIDNAVDAASATLCARPQQPYALLSHPRVRTCPPRASIPTQIRNRTTEQIFESIRDSTASVPKERPELRQIRSLLDVRTDRMPPPNWTGISTDRIILRTVRAFREMRRQRLRRVDNMEHSSSAPSKTLCDLDRSQS